MPGQAVVYKEHTLGILYEYEEFNVIQPLRASVLKGAPFSVHDAPFYADPAFYRPATKADFDDYRVMWHPDYQVADAV